MQYKRPYNWLLNDPLHVHGHSIIICKTNDDGVPVDAFYIDFSKAFDTVSHSKLLHKLKSYNFCASTINWITSFLADRTQAVKCNQTLSSSVHVTSGVPEGSVIGPVLLFYLLTIYHQFVIHALLNCMQMM